MTLGSSGPSSALDESGSGSFLPGLHESVTLTEVLCCGLSVNTSTAGKLRLNLETVGDTSADGKLSTSSAGASTCWAAELEIMRKLLFSMREARLLGEFRMIGISGVTCALISSLSSPVSQSWNELLGGESSGSLGAKGLSEVESVLD